jgi:hypothetical protein
MWLSSTAALWTIGLTLITWLMATGLAVFLFG